MSYKIVLGSEIAIKSSFNKIRRQRATLTGAASQGRNIRLTTDNGDNINVIVVHWNQFVLFAQVCLDKKLFIFVRANLTNRKLNAEPFLGIALTTTCDWWVPVTSSSIDCGESRSFTLRVTKKESFRRTPSFTTVYCAKVLHSH